MTFALVKQLTSALLEFSSTTRLYALTVGDKGAELCTGELLVEAFLANEALQEIGARDVIVLSTSAHIALETLLGQRASLAISLCDGTRTGFEGDISEVAMLGSDGGFARYRVRISPWLWRLGQVRNSRVWQDKTVIEMIDAVFQPYLPLARWRWSDDARTQLHLTMQSLVFGSYSLVNRIRQAILVQRLCEDRTIGVKEAQAVIGRYTVSDVIEKGKDDWKDYLTLLNLRSWELLEKRPVTEQIYVHSKLLIADDRVAILGSANINDRSQLGDRDSELAVIVRDDDALKVKLDGVHEGAVSANVHRLRVRLWKKLFGLMGGAHPATALAAVVDKPAARDTWEAIQRIAHSNALAYQKAFPFLAKVEGKPSPIWPTWDRDTRRLISHMPFNERFWRQDEVMDEPLSWEAKSRAQEGAPSDIQGFIVALPVSWTAGEDNSSKMTLTLLANNRDSRNGNRYLASAGKDEYANPNEWSQNAKPVV